MFQQALASCAGCSLLGAAKDGGQASGRPRGEVFLTNPTAYENLHDPRHLVPGEVWGFLYTKVMQDVRYQPQ